MAMIDKALNVGRWWNKRLIRKVERDGGGSKQTGPWNYLIRLSGEGWCGSKVRVVWQQSRVVCA